VKQLIHDKLIEHRLYIREHGDDIPEVRDWKWTGGVGTDQTQSKDQASPSQEGAEGGARSGS